MWHFRERRHTSGISNFWHKGESKVRVSRDWLNFTISGKARSVAALFSHIVRRFHLNVSLPYRCLWHLCCLYFILICTQVFIYWTLLKHGTKVGVKNRHFTSTTIDIGKCEAIYKSLWNEHRFLVLGFCTACELNFPTTFREPMWVPKLRRKIYLAHLAKSLKPEIKL